MIKPQWFVKMEEMAKPAHLNALKTGDLNFVPERFDKDHICTGWKTSVTGVFPDSCGGDTGFRLITVTTAARS